MAATSEGIVDIADLHAALDAEFGPLDDWLDEHGKLTEIGTTSQYMLNRFRYLMDQLSRTEVRCEDCCHLAHGDDECPEM